MKCPSCKTNMKEGYLISHGSTWVEGRINPWFLWTSTTRVIANKCPSCEKIELVAEPKK